MEAEVFVVLARKLSGEVTTKLARGRFSNTSEIAVKTSESYLARTSSLKLKCADMSQDSWFPLSRNTLFG